MQKEVQRTRRPFTVGEYYKMADMGILYSTVKVELIKDEIFNKNPITSLHAGMVNRLSRELIRKLGNTLIISTQKPAPYSQRHTFLNRNF